ncbi:hypothetical protein [Vampirovibrio sp.]|uniref:hypothetical protein n=1 Tax=Vampirovibrio sp. TaxID=2717857 RepID=UPI0035939A49
MPFYGRFVAFSMAFLFSSSVCMYADSIRIEGPGMKVENRRGWFGTKSTRYQDAMGNSVSTGRGILGRQESRTKIFGTESIRTPRETSILDAQGNPLVKSRKTWFHGKETQVDGNAIIHSFQGLFQP